MPMKFPRPRFTVRRLMLVAALAAILTGLRAFAGRPYPVTWFGSAAYYITWSDRTGTAVNMDLGQRPLVIREYRFATLVEWPDGGTGFYLHADPGS